MTRQTSNPTMPGWTRGNRCYTVLVENAVRTADPTPDDMEDIEVLFRPREALLRAFRDGDMDIGHGLVLNAFSHYFNPNLMGTPDFRHR